MVWTSTTEHILSPCTYLTYCIFVYLLLDSYVTCPASYMAENERYRRWYFRKTSSGRTQNALHMKGGARRLIQCGQTCRCFNTGGDLGAPMRPHFSTLIWIPLVEYAHWGRGGRRQGLDCGAALCEEGSWRAGHVNYCHVEAPKCQKNITTVRFRCTFNTMVILLVAGPRHFGSGFTDWQW